MSEIASLGVKIDSTDATRAAGELDKLTAAGARTEKAINRLHEVAQRTAADMSALNGRVDTLNGTQNRMLAAVERVASQMDRMAASYERSARAAGTAARAYDQVGREASGSAANVDRMNRSLTQTESSAAAAGASIRRHLLVALSGLSVMRVIDMADEWGQMASRIRMATQSADEYERVQARMLQSANATYRNINETREAFIQLSPVLRQMGMSLEESMDAIDAFSGLLVVNSANAERGAAAMRALAVALQKGKLDANGWITIYSTVDSIVDVLAEHTGIAAEELRRLGAEGKLSVEMLAQSLVGQVQPIMQQVEGMPTTVRDALQRVGNAFGEYIGTANEANHVTATMARGIELVGEHMEGVMTVAIAAGTAGLARYAAGLAATVTQTTAQALQARIAAAEELRLAQAQMAAAQASVAQTAAMRGLTATMAQQTAAANALAAAEARLAAAKSGAALAGRSLLGILGGPAGIAITAGLAATAFLTMGQSADTASTNIDALTVSLEKLTASQAQQAIQSLEGLYKGAEEEAKRYAAQVEWLNMQLRMHPSSKEAENWNRELVDARGNFDTASQKAEGYRQRIAELEEQIRRLNGVAGATDIVKTSEAAAKYLERLSDQSIVAGLKTQRERLEALVKAEKLTFSPEDLDRARQFADHIDSMSKSGLKAADAFAKWMDQTRIATASAQTMIEAYLTGGDAISQLSRQVEIEAKVLEHGAKARDTITAAIHAQQSALDRLDIAKQIDDLRRQAQAGTQYVAVLAAQSKGYAEGRAALTAYNREQARAELLVGKTASEVADLLETYEALWDSVDGVQRQREAMEELNGLVESTATRQERYNRELEKLLALAPYAQTEEQARALQRAIEDLNRENSVWFEFTQDAIERINEAFADMWRDAFDGSRSAFDGMKRAFRQMLAEMAHAAITRPIVISLGNAIMGTNTPGGIGDVWGGGNRVLGTAQNLYSGYNAVSGGLSNTLGNAAQWLGQKIGSEALTSFGLGLSGTTAATGIASIGAGLGASLGTTIGTSAAAMTSTTFAASMTGGAVIPGLGVGVAGGGVGAGIGAAGAAAGGAAAGGAAGFGAAVGAALPWIGGALAIGSLLGGGLFDREPTTRREQRTQVEYAGGIFDITKTDDRAPAGADAAARALAEQAVATANDIFKQVGVDAAIDSFHAIMASSYKGDRDGVASGGRLRIGDQYVQFGIQDDENPTIKGFGGWSSAETLPRLATDIQLSVLEAFQSVSDQLPGVLSAMLEGIDVRSLGEQEAQALAERFTMLTQGATQFLAAVDQMPFKQLRDLSFDAAAAMVQFAGSVDNLLSAQQTYYDRYYSEQEKFEHSVNQLSQALSGVGVVMPALVGSTDDMLASYRALVESLDLNTEAGQQAYVTLMQTAGAFADVAQFAGQAQGAVDGVAAGLQSMTSILTGAVQHAYSEVVRLGQEQIAQLQQTFGASDSALNNYRSAVQRFESEWGGLISTMARSMRDLRGQVEASARLQYDQARAVISTTLLTGQLPQTADLSEAIRVAQQGVMGQRFASREDQQRAYLTLANEIEALQAIAQPELDTARATLEQLENQYRLLRGMSEIGEGSLTALEEQLRLAIVAEEAARYEISVVEQQLEVARQQYEAALGLNTLLEDLPTALQSLADALANLSLGGGASLNPQSYAAANPDLVKYYYDNPEHRGGLSLDQWLRKHYEEYGQFESRKGAPSGSGTSRESQYLANNPDVLAAYRNSAPGMSAAEFARLHYEKYGRYEGRAFARGGYYPGGLALVGEEGPELINFARPGQVYRADQTQDILRQLNSPQGGNTAALERRIDELIRVVEYQNQHIREINKSSKRTANNTEDTATAIAHGDSGGGVVVVM